MSVADLQLVQRSRNGDRQAFGQIVEQYQNLICSLAYGWTGNLSQSEELAQETFLAAWRQMDQLRDPKQLKPWLCGILRNLVRNNYRRSQRDVLHAARADRAVESVATQDDDPVSATIEREEIDLMDRTLEGIPPKYREPLVLFYREQQSVARVAESLDLSTDAVKQRLARGRNLLRKEIAAIVESGLRQSAPGRAFTLGVLAALPVMSGTAKAATITATGAKGIGAMHAAGWTAYMGAILGPLAGIAGAWFGIKMSLRHATSERERSLYRRGAVWLIGLIVVFTAGLTGLLLQGERLVQDHPRIFAAAVVAITGGYVVLLVGSIFYMKRKADRIRFEEGAAATNQATATPTGPPFAADYESPYRFLGLPLISIRLGTTTDPAKPERPAIGWIAVGNRAYGLIACGTIAVGGFATGAVGIGVFSFAGLALGLFPIGGGAVGWMSTGGFAVGVLAFGGCAIAWKMAVGGLAVGHHFALGGLAIADQANTEAARSLFAQAPFFRVANLLSTHPWIWLVLMSLSLLPFYWAHKAGTEPRMARS